MHAMEDTIGRDHDDTATMAAIETIVAGERSVAHRLEEICRVLVERMPGYDWVGFYVVDPLHPDELILGPYVGEPTEHVRIAFGRGICGQAAQQRRTFVIDDVTAESNYLACSPRVRSEIVLPIWRGNELIGELDIDSHSRRRFSGADERFLGSVCARVAALVDAYRVELERDGAQSR